MSGLEIIRTLNDLDIKTKRPIMIVNWTNEEGCRFAPALMASSGFVGALNVNEILDAKDGWSKAEVRKAYKALIKILHPDMNGGDRSQEEQLQEVVWAWDQIKDSRNFK